MTFREFSRMSQHDRDREIWEAAKIVNRALNLYGAEELIKGLEKGGFEWLRRPSCNCRRGDPSCTHSFPKWFIKDAEPEIKYLERLMGYQNRISG